MSLRPPAGIPTPAGTLEYVLTQHRLWLESHGREGSRAELPVCDLQGADLRRRDLRQADLAMANLSAADLSRARLGGANLVAANFRHAILCDANLSDFAAGDDYAKEAQATIPLNVPTILDGADFGGADLTIAKFPRQFTFSEPIRQTLFYAGRARNFAIALGILLIGVLFQIGAVRDERLLLPEIESADMFVLDVLATKFVFLGATILAVLAYGLLIFGSLRKLCLARNQLPACLPDGASIDANRALWPLNMLAAQWMPQLRDDRLEWRTRMPVWITLAALFVLPPLVSVLAWWRFLSIHEWWSSAVMVTAAALAIGAAYFGWIASARALGGQGDRREASGPAAPGKSAGFLACAASLLAAVALIALSYGVIERGLAPYLAARADIAFRNLATFPPNVLEQSVAAVRGPDLAGRNLRHARISYSSLVNADLRNARLDHAAITVSDLRRANLSGADLREAALFASDLESALLSGADLRGATLHCVVGLDGAQLAAARTDGGTILPDGSAGPFQLGSSALTVKADACAHWAPGNAPPVGVDIPQPLSTVPNPPPAVDDPSASRKQGGEAAPGESATPAEPDFSPIEELKPTRKVPTPTNLPSGSEPPR